MVPVSSRFETRSLGEPPKRSRRSRTSPLRNSPLSIAGSNSCALPIFFTFRRAPFSSSLYTSVCTVVYATRSASGRLSRISRTEQVPSFQNCPRIRVSAFDRRMRLTFTVVPGFYA